MARSINKRNGALSTMLFEVAAITYAVIAFVNGRWLDFLWSFCVSVAIPAWLFAVRAPTYCYVTTIRGHPCPNPTYGVLFGCGSAKGHTWAKFFARFGWRRQPRTSLAGGRSVPSASTPVAALPLASTASTGTVTVRIEEDRKSRATFWMAAISTLTGIVSAAIELAGAFRTS